MKAQRLNGDERAKRVRGACSCSNQDDDSDVYKDEVDSKQKRCVFVFQPRRTMIYLTQINVLKYDEVDSEQSRSACSFLTVTTSNWSI
ncbi:hypothetical protein CARUB_v10002355mg [Capsella rubella]|uniref:Uncharacterized protein n=1 Tax=Capsella rubella TaxID=81985 RepID=R0GYA6_9BRAS|nr:hypothetical protein CARUB_v10002355mg [Capsella rubella]